LSDALVEALEAQSYMERLLPSKAKTSHLRYSIDAAAGVAVTELIAAAAAAALAAAAPAAAASVAAAWCIDIVYVNK
jgi:hypothetical protein